MISLSGLHLIAALNNCKTNLQFFYCNFYIGLDKAINVKRTARLQWKVDTVKNCKYLQCMSYVYLVQATLYRLDNKALATNKNTAD